MAKAENGVTTNMINYAIIYYHILLYHNIICRIIYIYIHNIYIYVLPYMTIYDQQSWSVFLVFHGDIMG